MAEGLSPHARRWRTIIVTVPIIGATSLVLYQRLVQGKPRRTLPKDMNDPEQARKKIIELKPENTQPPPG
ncbi:hypothetical protein K474DRAFT_1660876 [Panus rudis PR-1116 ss-1]|nr:hypothetical protein K474DRAFT_1660876 [Panus rudis PR-1116 ss-1]